MSRILKQNKENTTLPYLNLQKDKTLDKIKSQEFLIPLLEHIGNEDLLK